MVNETNNPTTNEILQENHYYPFGLNTEGPWMNDAALDNKYQYNGKEWNDDFGLNWNDYGARWYDAAVGRFTSIDPLADEAPDWTTYRYAFDNPLIYIDPDGLFETRKDAKKYAKDNGIGTGLFSGNKIRKQEDGSFAISSRQFMGDDAMMVAETFITDMGGDIGVVTGVAITPNDVVDREDSFFTIGFVKRDGSTTEFDRPLLGPPAGGAVSKGGVTLMGYTFGQLRKALKNVYKKLDIDEPIKQKEQGKFGSPMRDDGTKGYRLDPPHPNTTKPGEQVPHINWWDRTFGKKRNKGLREGAEPIIDPNKK